MRRRVASGTATTTARRRPTAEPKRPLRLPAREIEGLVESELCRLLRDEHRMLDLLPQATASQVQERRAFALRWLNDWKVLRPIG